jgi:hypothetical protein
MMKLRKRLNIILFLIMVIVLVFYAINRLNIKMPSTIVGDQYCGDQICQFTENQNNCCEDCGCPSGQVCVDNECQVGDTTTTIFGTTQTTEHPPEATGGPSSTEESTSPSGEQTTETTTTTLYMGCSVNNCEACENTTACYSVGCIWCKVSNRCRIICKG